MTLEQLRSQIDQLDQSILQMLNQRAEYVLEIGRIKRQQQVQIHVPAREQQILDDLSRTNPGPLSNEAVRLIFQCIMEQMRAIQ